MPKYHNDNFQKSIKDKVRKFTKTFIIAVDGVDGAGKSTFIRNLKNELEKVLDADKVAVNIQHFPNYDIDSGKDIKYLLMNYPDLFASSFIALMTNLNRYNRYVTLSNFKLDKDKKFHIILLDRYKSSNDFYNIMRYRYRNNGEVDNSRDVYRDIINAHLNEMGGYYTPEPDLQIFATIDEKLQLERLSRKMNKDKFEETDNIHFVNNLFSKYIDLRLPLKYKEDKYYPLFHEKYFNNQLGIDDKDYSLETDMESKLSKRCVIDMDHETINYYDPDSQAINYYDFEDEKDLFPYVCKEFNQFLHANILTLPMELFDEEYIENNYESLINKYPYLVRCKMACIPAFIAANDNKVFSIKKCKTKCIPRMIMDRVVDIISFNILNQ